MSKSLLLPHNTRSSKNVFRSPTLSDDGSRYPKSLIYVFMDSLEKLYIAGFPLLLAFATAFPLLLERSQATQLVGTAPVVAYGQCPVNDAFTCPNTTSTMLLTSDLGAGVPSSNGGSLQAMEFLPLMATSVYCAVGLVWSFMRLGFIYLNEESSYRGQLSEVN